MTYSVRFKPAAEREFQRMAPDIQRRIRTKIDALTSNPRPPGVVMLQGPEKLNRIRAGDYRIVYEIRDAILIVLVVKIGHRSGIYR